MSGTAPPVTHLVVEKRRVRFPPGSAVVGTYCVDDPEGCCLLSFPECYLPDARTYSEPEPGGCPYADTYGTPLGRYVFPRTLYLCFIPEVSGVSTAFPESPYGCTSWMRGVLPLPLEWAPSSLAYYGFADNGLAPSEPYYCYLEATLTPTSAAAGSGGSGCWTLSITGGGTAWTSGGENFDGYDIAPGWEMRLRGAETPIFMPFTTPLVSDQCGAGYYLVTDRSAGREVTPLRVGACDRHLPATLTLTISGTTPVFPATAAPALDGTYTLTYRCGAWQSSLIPGDGGWVYLFTLLLTLIEYVDDPGGNYPSLYFNALAGGEGDFAGQAAQSAVLDVDFACDPFSAACVGATFGVSTGIGAPDQFTLDAAVTE